MVAAGKLRLAELAESEGRGDFSFEVRVNSPLYLGDDHAARLKTKRDGRNELVGSVQSVIERIADFEEAGADAMNLRCWAEDPDRLAEMMETFATDVMPHFR